MVKKTADDYLQEGIYGIKKPKQEERDRFLGTLRERIVLALTIGQVMQDKGLNQLDEAMKQYPNSNLLLNGQISFSYLKKVKETASRYGIPYTSVANEEKETDIGAVLTLDHAIELENIFIDEMAPDHADVQPQPETAEKKSWAAKFKNWLS